MFILIPEDCTPKYTAAITQEDLQAADDGYLTILNIHSDVVPTEYYNGKWSEIEVAPIG